MLPDILGPGLTILFCGTAAGHASAARGHYYAGPGNRFWPMLAETGLTPRRLLPEEDHMMPGFGYGLTDLAKDVSGMDAEIPPEAFAPARLAALVAQHRPRAVAFTSLTAARLALDDRDLGPGRLAYHPLLPETVLFALPSPSGAARGTFSPLPWQALAQWRRECST